MASKRKKKKSLDSLSSANIHIVNDKWDVLSLAGDDSCGSFPKLTRLSMVVMNQNGEEVVKETSWTTPVEFLEALADHLGFTITTKESQI